METPTIVRQTKNYMLIKVPLPKGGVSSNHRGRGDKMTAAEKRLWRTIQEGEKEYREGKTIRAKSIDEALRIYGRQKGNKLD